MKDFSKLEKLSLSFALGMGEMSLLMFFLGLFNIPLTADNILSFSLGLCLLLFILVFIKTGNPFSLKIPKLKRPSLVESLLILLIL